MEQTAEQGQDQRWGIVLAGGEGTRLRPLTRRITGDERPKQFCPIIGGETLLEATLRRTTLAIPGDRTLVVVAETHKAFYKPLLQSAPPHCVVAQPENRGTTAAILYALLRAATLAPEGSVAIFPSDHYISNDEAFMRYLEFAFEAARSMAESAILLGIRPDYPEVEYGWIEPGIPILLPAPVALFRVRRFWEKPLANLAQKLLSRGCLWNSFVIVGRIQALLSLIEGNAPALYRGFGSIRHLIPGPREADAVGRLYRSFSCSNFSQEVLSRCPASLAVLPVLGIEWSDWGDPSRVLTSLARSGIRPEWASASLAAVS